MRRTRWREMPETSEVLRLYATGLTQDEVADALDVSQWWVSATLRRQKAAATAPFSRTAGA